MQNVHPFPGPKKTDRFVSDLVECFDKELKGYLCRLLGDRDDAAEVAQDAYLKLYRICKPDEVRNPKALLYRTATNLAMDKISHRAKHAAIAQIEEDDYEVNRALSPEQDATSDRALQLLNRVVGELPPRRRQVLVMHKFMGMTHPEIAASLGISRSMVEQHMTRALAYCRERMGSFEDFL